MHEQAAPSQVRRVRLTQIGDGLPEGIECRGRADDEESEEGLIGCRVPPKCP